MNRVEFHTMTFHLSSNYLLVCLSVCLHVGLAILWCSASSVCLCFSSVKTKSGQNYRVIHDHFIRSFMQGPWNLRTRLSSLVD